MIFRNEAGGCRYAIQIPIRRELFDVLRENRLSVGMAFGRGGAIVVGNVCVSARRREKRLAKAGIS